MASKPSLRVGLTGGIASGKSTVAGLFAAHGVEIVDADRISREVVQPGQPALEEIRRAFGAGVIDASGRLDRGRMREIVFEDADALTRLEQIIHPRVISAMRDRVEQSTSPYIVLDIPLLVEESLQGEVDRVLVVDLPEHLQRQRLASRDGVDEAEIDAVLAAQASREQRLAAADDVLDNSGPLSELPARVAQLHRRYLELASAPP